MLEIKGVTKKYGKITANDNISLSIGNGEISVLLGPNGAGKSTLIKSIAGLLRYSGEISVNSLKNNKLQAKAELGYIPEMPAVYDMLTVSEHLEFILKAYKKEDDGYGEELLEAFQLDKMKNKLGKELSKGMQQKLSICCALVHRPSVVIFDEPMVGLDPFAIEKLKEIFLSLRMQGASVLISTHMIDSVEDYWDTAYIMNKGKLVSRVENIPGVSLRNIFFSVTNEEQSI